MKKWFIKGLALALALMMCMCATAVAEETGSDGFTPSATGKDAPEVWEDQGTTGIGVAPVVDGGAFIVTPVSSLALFSSIISPEVAVILARAYVNIRDTYDLSDLKAWEPDLSKRFFDREEEVDAILEAVGFADFATLAESLEYQSLDRTNEDVALLGPDLDAALAALNSTLTGHDLVVRDLFSVSACGMYDGYMHQEGSYVDIDFYLGLNPGDTLVTLFSDDGEYWEVIPSENLLHEGNGFTRVHLTQMGVVAFAVPVED